LRDLNAWRSAKNHVLLLSGTQEGPGRGAHEAPMMASSVGKKFGGKVY